MGKSTLTVIATVASALVAGCVAEQEPSDEGEIVAIERPHLLDDNGMGTNGLPDNGLIANALAANALAQNAISYNGLLANGVIANALAASGWQGDLVRHFFRYAASCALEPGRATTYDGPEGTVTVWGQMGYAPEWEWGPLSWWGGRMVSACVLARVNARGRSVTISLEREGEPSDWGYVLHEGSFWGDLFLVGPWTTGIPWAQSCNGYDAEYVRDHWDRVCTLEDCGLIVPIHTNCWESGYYGLGLPYLNVFLPW